MLLSDLNRDVRSELVFLVNCLLGKTPMSERNTAHVRDLLRARGTVPAKPTTALRRELKLEGNAIEHLRANDNKFAPELTSLRISVS